VVDLNSLKNDLQNIICGEIKDGKGELIKTAQTYLGKSFATGPGIEKKKQSREQEEEKLRGFISHNNLWLSPGVFGTYITEGAEQKVYFPEGSDDVIKVSDAVFYIYWEDYFNNLLVHNYLFPDTAYTLTGFYTSKNILFAVLRQRFIQSTEMTDLNNVRQFMQSNGFLQKKNNDYYNPFLGIIIEDLHEENVLTNNGVLFLQIQ
jgi:hypothetical protein